MSTIPSLPTTSTAPSAPMPAPATSKMSQTSVSFPFIDSAMAGKPSFMTVVPTGSIVKGRQGITNKTVEILRSDKKVPVVPMIETPLQQLQNKPVESETLASKPAESNVEAAPSAKDHPLMAPAQGVVKGLATAVAVPFNGRLAQIATTAPGQQKPRLIEAFRNVGRATFVGMVGRMIGGVCFMTTYSRTSNWVNEKTDSPVVQAIAPPVASSVVLAAVKTPGENVSQRLQLGYSKTIMDSAKAIFAQKGVAGFYQGNLPQFTANTLNNVIVFAGAKLVSDRLTGGSDTEASVSRRLASNFFSGAVVGSLATPVTHPIYRILVVQRKEMISFFQALEKVVAQGAERSEGPLRGVVAELYKGFHIANMRKVSVVACMIMGMEAVRIGFEKKNK